VGALLRCAEFVPYLLRAADLDSVVPTLNKRFNVRVTFYETDMRTHNRFKLTQVTDTLVEGDSNWIAYRIMLNEPNEYDVDCFKSLDTFMYSFDVPAPTGR
jgi:hypothetical protein